MTAIIKAEAPNDEQAIAGQVVTQGKTTYQFLHVPANTVEGEVLVKAYDGDEESNPKAVAATTSAFNVMTVVATKDQGSTAGFQWCVIEGECQALVDGTNAVAKDDFLEVINTGSAFIQDGTARTTVSGAIAREAQTTAGNTLTDVYVIGEGHTIAAS